MKSTENLSGELLVELEELGVTFDVIGEKLKYKDTKGAFSEKYREKVKENKDEIIEILRKDQQTLKDFVNKDQKVTEYPLTDVQAAYLIGKTEAIKWGGIDCKGYVEVNFDTYNDEELLKTWEILVNRHEMLRARVRETGFEILEREDIEYRIETVDMRAMSEKEKKDRLIDLRKEFNEYKFDLECPPLFKAVITKRKEGTFFHLLVDLIILDFSSMQILISEMGTVLRGIPLKTKEINYLNYVLFDRQRKGGMKWYRDRAYWLNRIKDLPESPTLPKDGRAADKGKDPREFYRFQRRIDKTIWERIKRTSGEYGVTVSAVLIGLYAEVIARWSENKHFIINLPVQNRNSMISDIDNIVGDFTTVNLLEVNLTRSISFVERVKEIASRLLEDLEHNSFTGIEVLRELSKKSDNNEILMPIVFTGLLKSRNDIGTIEYGFSHTPQVWIDCQVVEELDMAEATKGLFISWDIRKGIIKKSIVVEMFETFINTVNFLGSLKAEEWERALEITTQDMNKKVIFYEPLKEAIEKPYIHQEIIEYARRNPKKIAVIDSYEKVTYDELLKRAEYIAGYLLKKSQKSNRKFVAIRMKKSANQIAAVLGVLIARLTYLPIDVKQPLIRQEKVLEKAKVVAELNQEIVEKILKEKREYLEEYPECENSIAYIIFTSGSTGEPKGVMMSHVAARNTLISLKNIYKLTEKDTVLGIAELSFDLSVFDIFGVLGSGGTLILPDSEKGPDASHWGELVKEYRVTVWNTVPAQAEILEAFSEKIEKYLSIRLVLLSGDWINISLPRRLRKIMPNARIISLGGATEGGIWSVFHEINEIEETPSILYGKALPGQWMGIVDNELRICPRYAVGQIAIGGYSLAEGYLEDSELTGEKFVYVNDGKDRIYLTGDRGRYVENDDIEFLGRLDNQVKINGYRIEIAEIEAALMEVPEMEECCVVYIQQKGKGRLVAFIKEKKPATSDGYMYYRKFLEQILPAAMIPTAFIHVDKIPLSSNGKVDRNALKRNMENESILDLHINNAENDNVEDIHSELERKIMEILINVSGNSDILYDDDLLEQGFDSLLLSQAAGKIANEILEAKDLRFDEILRVALATPTIAKIARYIGEQSDIVKQKSGIGHKNIFGEILSIHKIIYVIGMNKKEWTERFDKELNNYEILVKEIEGHELKEEIQANIEIANKYLFIDSNNVLDILKEAGELLAQGIIINKVFLVNPENATNNDLYLGDMVIINGTQQVIDSWRSAVLGTVKVYNGEIKEICDVVKKEVKNENEK